MIRRLSNTLKNRRILSVDGDLETQDQMTSPKLDSGRTKPSELISVELPVGI